MAKVNLPLENISTDAREELKQVVNTLAAGGRVRLGEFGDAVTSTTADEIGMVLYELANQI